MGRSTKTAYTDMTGRRFGRLVVVEYAGSYKSNGNARWLCLCDCGKTKVIDGHSLRHSLTISCGCFSIEKTRKRSITHGLSGTKEYTRAFRHKRNELERKLDSCWTVEMELAILSYFPTCVVCGSGDRMHTDHVKPLSKGYGLEPGNAVRLCIHCNSSKGKRDLKELPADMRNKIIRAAADFRAYWEEEI